MTTSPKYGWSDDVPWGFGLHVDLTLCESVNGAGDEMLNDLTFILSLADIVLFYILVTVNGPSHLFDIFIKSLTKSLEGKVFCAWK